VNTLPAVRDALRAHGFNANRIARGLYQGAFPPPGPSAARFFDLVVFCAMEVQPPVTDYPGVRVLRCPLNDDGRPMTGDEWVRARAAAAEVAIAVLDKKRALVSCYMGINRSGLVSALALRIVEAMPAAVCLKHVQRARPGALRNRYFAEALSRA
jgi:predicted protein tyrosine phosphatase